MSENLDSVLQKIPVIDVHEHHMPDIMLKQDVGLLQLLRQSYAGWTQSRAYRLPSEPPIAPASGSGRGTWPDIAVYVEGSGTNAFVRNMVHALGELYDMGSEGITERNWTDLDARIRKRHADSTWNETVLDRCGVRTAISDPYTDPFADIRKSLGDRYYSVLRINAFAVGWHPESRDHNGNSASEMLARQGIWPRTFDDYLQSLSSVLDLLSELHKLGLKNALAYDRPVNFDDIDEELARSAWGNRDPGEAARKAFGDVVVDRLCRLAADREIPVQMHLGTGLIRSSRPLEAAGLIERNPRTRFLLMHLAYPWTDELLGMAFVYRNVWLDLTWSWLLSPNRFTEVIRQAIDVLPDESRMMLGGDTWHVEETYGAIGLARRLLSDALERCVRSGQFRYGDAERLARKILQENALRFFGLPPLVKQ
jgi:hypothetical protein